MRSLGWVPIQYDWYPYKMGKFGHRDMYRRTMIKEAQGADDDHLKAKGCLRLPEA